MEIEFVQKKQKQQSFTVYYKVKAYIYSIIISLSYFYFGYSVAIVLALPLSIISNYYSIYLKNQYIQAILFGVMPIGAMFGSVVSPFIYAFTTKKKMHYLITFSSILVSGISIISNFYTLLLARFILGFNVSIYTSVAGNYIRQLFFKKQKRVFGAILSCSRTAGMLYSFILSLNTKQYQLNQKIYINSFGCSYISVVQAIFIFFILPDSPGDFLQEHNINKAVNILKTLYQQKYIPIILDKLNSKKINTQFFITDKKQVKKNNTAYHIALIRHLCGASFTVIYAGQIMKDLGFVYAEWTPVFMNSIQFASGIMGISFVKIFRRDSLIIFGTVILSFITLGIAITDYYEYQQAVFVLLILYTIPCASCITNVAWSLPSQISNKINGKYVAIVSWCGLFITTVSPPLITLTTVNHSSYPIFLFFSFYLGIANFINIRTIFQLPYQIQLSNQLKL